MIKHIRLEQFKNVQLFDTDLEKINVLIGANNSGKSSVLQGVHFSILAEVVRRKASRETVPQNSLLYQPSYDFTLLRHDTPYTNYSGYTSTLTLTSDTCMSGENPDSFSITISKGKNYGNVSIKCRNSNAFRQLVTSFSDLYSVYVPGLSGIPLEERLQTRAVIRRATANGDANLYLRNILYYIKENGSLRQLNAWITKIFPKTSIELPYDPEQDLNIEVNVKQPSTSLPLELSGTGFLQIVQILAYTLLFKPKLLLLDEPDEHLHPSNQALLVDLLIALSDEMDVQIILCTHSRHILSCLDGEGKIIWMKNGRIKSNDTLYETYDVLLDIGALDAYDRVIEGTYRYVVLTEDRKTKLMKNLLKYNGFNMKETLVVPYKGCANIDAAIQLADFIHRNAPNCKVIIHRDRDFMTNDEATKVEERITGQNTLPFVTDYSDIEAYFITPKHIGHLMQVKEDDIEQWLTELAQCHHVDIQEKFSKKRLDIKYSFLYRDNRELCPDTLTLFGRSIPTASDNRLGKYMMKKVNGAMHDKFGKEVSLMQNSPHLTVAKLQSIKHNPV